MEAFPVTDHLHPDFAVEALEGIDPAEQQDLLEVVHRLPDAFPVNAGPKAVLARLLDETSRAPERYTPFTRRLSELYDIALEDTRRLLERSADPKAWKASGLPGIKKLPVAAGPSRQGSQTYLVKFAAGAHFPEHRHDGLETVLLLAGSYTESGGKVYETGDMHFMEPGTAHSFTIAADEDCVAATLLHGRLNFRSLPLRLLARILGH
jgi:predicted ChrR family anti-sigma factor